MASDEISPLPPALAGGLDTMTRGTRLTALMSAAFLLTSAPGQAVELFVDRDLGSEAVRLLNRDMHEDIVVNLREGAHVLGETLRPVGNLEDLPLAGPVAGRYQTAWPGVAIQISASAAMQQMRASVRTRARVPT